MISGYDKWLTTEPHDREFDQWCDYFFYGLDHFISPEIEHFHTSDLFSYWMETLYLRGKKPTDAAAIIARAYKRYQLGNPKLG